MNEKRRLCEGDIVSFGGSSRVKISPGARDETNPFIFRVKHLVRVFESSAADGRAIQSLEETQRPATQVQGDCIDLTVSRHTRYQSLLETDFVSQNFAMTWLFILSVQYRA